MDKKFYQKKSRELFNKRNQIDEELDALREKYIEENRPCNIEDIVEVETRDRREKGMVVDFYIGPDDEVKPLLRKIKKDGTASSNRLRVWHNEWIIYPEKAQVQTN